MFMRASDVSPRMFQNDLLDSLSRTHWLAVPIVWVPVVVGMLAYALWSGVGALTVVGMFAVGWVVWSLSEYWLHRKMFHWIPNTSWGPQFHFLFHGVHHTWHKDPYRLVLPPSVSIPFGSAFFLAFWLVAQALAPWVAPGWHHALFAGFVAGYIQYDCTHYFLHHVKPWSARMKRLRAHHMNHHHNNPDAKFGVSNMVWDRVFGTL